MGETTAIEWTDASWNPLRARARLDPMNAFDRVPPVGWHCEHVSEGCRNCYAETMNKRLGTGLDYKPGNLAPRGPVTLFLDEKLLLAPLKWRKTRRIFLSSMTDIFGDWVIDADLDRIFAVMALCPQHVFQVLTKRPERMRDYLAARPAWRWLAAMKPIQVNRGVWKPATDGPGAGQVGGIIETINGVLPNVWLGVSVEDQAAANARIQLLLDTPAAKRFLSCEPLLGPVDLTKIDALAFDDEWLGGLDALGGYNPNVFGGKSMSRLAKIDWVIAGGESGPGARPMHPDWARSLRDQCAAAGVPFLFKQWGEWTPVRRPNPVVATDRWVKFHTVANPLPGAIVFDETAMRKLGKKRAGRLLDGVQHDGMPA